MVFIVSGYWGMIFLPPLQRLTGKLLGETVVGEAGGEGWEGSQHFLSLLDAAGI